MNGDYFRKRSFGQNPDMSALSLMGIVVADNSGDLLIQPMPALRGEGRVIRSICFALLIDLFNEIGDKADLTHDIFVSTRASRPGKVRMCFATRL
jgi:hypothetical protein